MKLPDFSNHSGFNALREEMAADLLILDRDLEWERLIIQLQHEGIDVPIEDVDIQPDGSFEYKGQKVVVYIRDQYARFFEKGYKFHLAHCNTLESMSQKRRYSRYVVTNRTDGKFIVNLLEDGEVVEEGLELEMAVCKNCISTLRLKTTADNFNLSEFFKHNSSRINQKPKHTENTAPINIYPDDWDKISRDKRTEKNWTCQECRIDLSEHKELLHVHHIDGEKSNNRSSNLQVLCVACHAEQPGHEYMKATPDYKRCLRLRQLEKVPGLVERCPKCGYKNRIASHWSNMKPFCGNCKSPLRSPESKGDTNGKNGTSLEENVLQMLKGTPGLRSRELAEKLKIDKSEVNSILYRLKSRRHVSQNKQYQWFLM